MSELETINEELSRLALEFAAYRQSGGRRRYPENCWKKAISISEKLSIKAVCQAIKVHPIYFRKKIANFSSSNEPMTFLEVPQQKYAAHNYVTISIEMLCGNKLKIDGANASCLVPLVHEFLKVGVSCCK